jgi:hypothetical protein
MAFDGSSVTQTNVRTADVADKLERNVNPFLLTDRRHTRAERDAGRCQLHYAAIWGYCERGRWRMFGRAPNPSFTESRNVGMTWV